MRAAVFLISTLVLGLCQAQFCTRVPANVINTAAEIPANTGVGGTYTFTCVAGSTTDGLSTGPTTFLATCTNPASTVQWDQQCIFYPNFCNDANQGMNRLTPTTGGTKFSSATFTCAPGYTITYAAQIPNSYVQVSDYSVSVVCDAVSFQTGTGLFVVDDISGRGRWRALYSGSFYPVYCEAISDFCPTNALPFSSVYLTADDQLTFTDVPQTLSRGTAFFDMGVATPTVTVSGRKNYVGDVSTANCQDGFDTDLAGASGSNPSVVCVSENPYQVGGGRWYYTAAPAQLASCVKLNDYCTSARVLYVNYAQLFPVNSIAFSVDEVVTTTLRIPNPEAEIICLPGYAVFPSSRSTSRHPLHCLPFNSTAGDYKHLIAPAADFYDWVNDFGPSGSGPVPCQPTEAYCSTEPVDQSSNYPFDYNTEFEEATIGEIKTLYCQEGYRFGSDPTWSTSVSRQCRTGANTLYPIGGAEVARQYGFFVEPGTGVFSNNNLRQACQQNNAYCGNPSGFSVRSLATGLSGSVTSAIANSIQDVVYSLDCPTGSSSDGFRTGAATRLYCAGNRAPSGWDLTGTWSTVASPATVIPATCWPIGDFCIKAVDGTWDHNDGPLGNTNFRTCQNGYSASTALIPAFNNAPSQQNLVCVEDTSANGIAFNSVTGQIGKWVVAPGGADLTNCVKSTFYCIQPGDIQSSPNFWSSTGSSGVTRTIDSTWSARCSAGYTLSGVKGTGATTTLTCTDSTAARGCWKYPGSTEACDAACVEVLNYCTAPSNVTEVSTLVAPTTVPINFVTTLVCEPGYTTDGTPARSAPSNLQIQATCSAFPGWSSGSDPNGVWLLAGGTQFNGCLPAVSYCSISSNVVSTVTGSVDDVATITCAVGYQIQRTGGSCTGPATREISATCTAATPTQGIWTFGSGCVVMCEQILDFCATDSTDPLRTSILLPSIYLGSQVSACAIGTALSNVDPAPQYFTRAEAAAAGLVISTITPQGFTAQCVTEGIVTASTVSGVFVVSGTNVTPACVPISDFCDTGVPLNPAYDHYEVLAALPGEPGIGPSYETHNTTAATGTYLSNLLLRCDVGYVLDQTPARYEENFLGVALDGLGSYYRNSDLFVCRSSGSFESSRSKGTGPDVCSRVRLCNFNPAAPRITRKVCYDPENPSSLFTTPCPLEAPTTFFCEVGYLPQAPATAGYYDSGANRAVISAATQAFCNLSTSNPTTTSSWTTEQVWTTIASLYWSGVWVPAPDFLRVYNYDFRRVSDGTIIDEMTLCQRTNNFCSSLALPNPNRSPFLTNVASLALTNRFVDAVATGFTCEKGYQLALGLNRGTLVSPSSTTSPIVQCKGNALIPEAGEWSILDNAVFEPLSCVLIDSYCQPTLGSNASVSSTADSGKLNTAGTYCCAAGYSTTGVSATGAFANLPMNCAVGPSANTVFARDGIWQTPSSAVPSCLLIQDFCPVVTGPQLSTSASGAGSIGVTAQYSCAVGYQLTGLGVTSATFTCSAPSNLCGQGNNTGSWRSGGQVPACEPIILYCPQTTITMVNRSAGSTTVTAPTPARITDTQTVVCANGWSSNGVAGVATASFVTTCGPSTPTAGAWSPTSCIPTTNYCAASTAANTVATQSIALFVSQTIDSVARVDCLTGYTVGGVNGGATTDFITCQPGTTGFGQWVVSGGAPLTTSYCQPATRTCSLTPPSATLGSNATGATDSFAIYTCVAGSTFTGLAAGGTSDLAQCLFSNKQWHIGGSVASCQIATDWCPTAATYNSANPGSILALTAAPTLGSTGGFSCRNGYSTSFTGSPVCRLDRTWSATACTLISSYCDNSALGSILTPGPAVASLGQTRSVTCAIGYQFISGAFLNVPVNCTALDQVKGVYKDSTGLDAFCGPIQSYCPTTTFSGVLTVTGALEIGATATLTCNTGFRLASGVSSIGVQCSANDRATGAWTNGGVVQNCSAIPNYCPSTIPVAVATVAATATVIGSNQLITCPVGWQATSAGSSATTVTCAAVPGSPGQGQWSLGGNAWTGCTRIPNFCPLDSIPDATLQTNASTIEADNVATCLPGNTATGLRSGATTFPVVCSASGWTDAGQPAACSIVLNYCDVLSLQRGSVATTDAALGSNNNFDCDTGYEYNGLTTVGITCNVTGAWVDSNGDAFRGCALNLNFCPDVIEANAVVSNGTNALNSVRTITCDAGYSSGGAATRTCLSTGNWSAVLVCADIDECLTNPCASTEVCTNEPGNYTCTACGLNEVVSNNQCVCDAPLYAGVAGNCSCTCAENASCGATACVCDAGYVNAVGVCELCSGDGQRCCDVSPSCGANLVCSNGYCTVPASPTPTPAAPAPALPPPTTSTPPSPSPSPSGGSSSADDSGRLVVLFAYLLL